jgi:hypothetical protein
MVQGLAHQPVTLRGRVCPVEYYFADPLTGPTSRCVHLLWHILDI